MQFLFSFIYFYLFILFLGVASRTSKCEELWCNCAIMQEIYLDTYEIKVIPKFWFRIFCLKIICNDNTLSVFIVLICFEIWALTKKSCWSLNMTSFFIFADDSNIGFCHVKVHIYWPYWSDHQISLDHGHLCCKFLTMHQPIDVLLRKTILIILFSTFFS